MKLTTGTPDDIFSTVRRHLSPGLALGYKMIGHGAYEVAARGATVQLSDGRELVDFGSYAVALLGHRHGAVVDAISEQLVRMPTATRALANPAVTGFVEDLLSRCGSRLDRVWLGSDGADAVEVAVKLARFGTGRPRILAVQGAFHGKTLGALALTWSASFRKGLSTVLAPVTHIHPDDRDAVAREARAGDVAALIVEPIQGENGVRPLPRDVVSSWAADAHAAGAFVISDEIQVGLRRCGEFSVALARDWQPDAVLFGKALGGGVVPLSAMVATPELYRPLTADPTFHSATFGGHPLACAAGSAALRAIDDLAEDGARVAENVERELRALADRHRAVVTGLRGSGLLWGMDFPTPAVAGSVLTELADHGLLVSPCLSADSTIRLLPPMVTSEQELRRAVDALDAALSAAAGYLPGTEGGG